MRSFILGVILLVLAFAVAAQAQSFDNTSLSGTITCSSTVAASSNPTVAASLNPLASGQITLVADGMGNWTAGTATYQLAGGVACNYLLAGGKYTVNADGTGESATRWSLAPGSSPQPNCAPGGQRILTSFSLPTNSFAASPGPNGSESGACTLAEQTTAPPSAPAP